MAESTITFDLLEDWKQDHPIADAPGPFGSNDHELVELVVLEQLFFDNNLGSCEKLGSQYQACTKNSGGRLSTACMGIYRHNAYNQDTNNNK